jgi:AcrR family transcriptional regulator
MTSKMPTTRPSLSPRTYHLHRERQRCRILEAAEALFDEKGIDRVTMTEIISATELRTSTIYQYFSSKDDLVWAILEDLLEEFSKRAKEVTDNAKTSLDKITALLELMAEDLTRNRTKVRFMAQFDAMYARDWSAERLLTLEAQIYPEGFRYFGSLIREGISDGSLRSDLNPELTMHAVMNAVVGTQRRLASLGSQVELEYGQPVDSLFRETTRVILRGLRAT